MSNEEKIMCKKLNELCGLTADKILELCNYDMKERYAVDIRAILHKLGIPVFDYDFSLFNQKYSETYPDREIDGAILLEDKDLFVFANSKYSESEKRFVIAHELAHCCLHTSTLKNKKIAFSEHSDHELGLKEKKNENEADAFAAELLLPEKALMTVYQSLKSKNIAVMADIFGVTVEVIRYRLTQLQLNFAQ